MKSEKMQQIEQEYKQYILEHEQESKDSGMKIKEYLDDSTAAYNGLVVHTLHIPKVFTEKEIEYFRWIVKTTYSIVTKVTQEYLDNPAYRKYFPFDKELEELILVPNLYDSLLPIARFDIFFNEKDWSFKFCEINTDGTSAMNEDYVLNQALELNDAHQQMLKKYKFDSFELYDSWVKSLMDIYATYEKKVDHPYVVITDFMDHCCVNEFKEFDERFKKAGYEAEICNIRDMTYRDGVLYSAAGHPIDVIYRRAVTCNIMAHYQEIQPFIQAVKDQNVCLIGSICTQIPHNKWLFKILRDKATQNILTEEENKFVEEHIPYTNLMDSRFCSMDAIMDEKDRWIIKPLDSYASQGVFAGIDYSDDDWEEIVTRHWNKNYIYQEYYHPYRTDNICFRDAHAQFQPYTNMSGLYVYNGEFAGIYSRLSTGGIISSQYNERAVATLVMKEEKL
ncbi:MAG: hypothetical protein EOM18_03315 [Clostridia bacterium]|nr:hypothetical protein [Clostridia bacterium]